MTAAGTRSCSSIDSGNRRDRRLGDPMMGEPITNNFDTLLQALALAVSTDRRKAQQTTGNSGTSRGENALNLKVQRAKHQAEVIGEIPPISNFRNVPHRPSPIQRWRAVSQLSRSEQNADTVSSMPSVRVVRDCRSNGVNSLIGPGVSGPERSSDDRNFRGCAAIAEF